MAYSHLISWVGLVAVLSWSLVLRFVEVRPAGVAAVLVSSLLRRTVPVSRWLHFAFGLVR